MFYNLREQLFSIKWWQSWAMVVLGTFIMCAGYVFFINPYFIVPGGIYGAGIVLHYMFPNIQIGTFGFMLDIPLLIIGIRVFGGMFGARTIVAAVLTPIFMNTMTLLVGSDPATILGGKFDLSDDTMLACLFGGVLIGAGVGIIIKMKATTGGTDIIAMLLVRRFDMTFSRAILLVDSCVVVFGIIVLGDWRLPLYSLITIFVISRVIDYVIEGASYDKLLFIISDKNCELESFIMDEMGRGATYIKSSGMYTKKNRDMIFLVISRREVNAVQHKIKEIDPNAFLVVVNAYETLGDGFKAFPERE